MPCHVEQARAQYYREQQYPQLGSSSSSETFAIQRKQASKPSQSPRRHPEIVPDSASNKTPELPVLTRCESAVPCSHVAPLYHVTLLPAFPPPVSRQTRTNFAHIFSGIFAFVHRWYHSRVCASRNPIIVIAVENGGTKSWRISTSRIATLGPTALSMVGFKIRQRGRGCV